LSGFFMISHKSIYTVTLCRTVSYDRLSTYSHSIILSANKRNFHRAWPCGGWLHPSANNCASPLPSSTLPRPALAFGLRPNAASKPSSTNLWRTLQTVLVWQPKASAIFSSLQLPVSASTFNKIWACLILYAGVFPLAIISFNCLRSVSVSLTMYFFIHSVPP